VYESLHAFVLIVFSGLMNFFFLNDNRFWNSFLINE
jgi:hypothetical protein